MTLRFENAFQACTATKALRTVQPLTMPSCVSSRCLADPLCEATRTLESPFVQMIIAQSVAAAVCGHVLHRL